MSGADDALQLGDTSVPQTLDAAYAMARHFGVANMSQTLCLTIVDFALPYKHVGVDIDRESFPYIALIKQDGEPVYAQLNTRPFGSKRAPINWGGVANSPLFTSGVFQGSARILRSRLLRNCARSYCAYRAPLHR